MWVRRRLWLLLGLVAALCAMLLGRAATRETAIGSAETSASAGDPSRSSSPRVLPDPAATAETRSDTPRDHAGAGLAEPRRVDPDAVGGEAAGDAASSGLLVEGFVAPGTALRSVSSDERVRPLLSNTCPVPVEISWIDYDGRERSYGVMSPGTGRPLPTYRGHAWTVRTLDGAELRRFVAGADPLAICDDAHQPGAAAFAAAPWAPSWPDGASSRSTEPVRVAIRNACGDDVELFWVDFRGEERSYGLIPDGDVAHRATYRGHLWRLRTRDGYEVQSFRAEGDGTLAACESAVLVRDA